MSRSGKSEVSNLSFVNFFLFSQKFQFHIIIFQKSVVSMQYTLIRFCYEKKMEPNIKTKKIFLLPLSLSLFLSLPLSFSLFL